MQIISNLFAYEVVLFCSALSGVEKVYNCIQVVFGIRNHLLGSCPTYLCPSVTFYQRGGWSCGYRCFPPSSWCDPVGRPSGLWEMWVTAGAAGALVGIFRL